MSDKNKPVVKVVPITDIKMNPLNSRVHTERGNHLVNKSIEKFGFIDAGTLDKNNVMVGGESRTINAVDVLDSDEAIIVEHDGKRPIYLKIPYLDMDTAEGQAAGNALNRTGEQSEYDAEMLKLHAEMGVELEDWWFESELEELNNEIPDVEFKEYDEEVQKDVQYCTCPNCGHKFPK